MQPPRETGANSLRSYGQRYRDSSREHDGTSHNTSHSANCTRCQWHHAVIACNTVTVHRGISHDSSQYELVHNGDKNSTMALWVCVILFRCYVEIYILPPSDKLESLYPKYRIANSACVYHVVKHFAVDWIRDTAWLRYNPFSSEHLLLKFRQLKLTKFSFWKVIFKHSESTTIFAFFLL